MSKVFLFDIDHFEKYNESIKEYINFLTMLAYREYEFSVEQNTKSSTITTLCVKVKDWRD